MNSFHALPLPRATSHVPHHGISGSGPPSSSCASAPSEPALSVCERRLAAPNTKGGERDRKESILQAECGDVPLCRYSSAAHPGSSGLRVSCMISRKAPGCFSKIGPISGHHAFAPRGETRALRAPRALTTHFVVRATLRGRLSFIPYRRPRAGHSPLSPAAVVSPA